MCMADCRIFLARERGDDIEAVANNASKRILRQFRTKQQLFRW